MGCDGSGRTLIKIHVSKVWKLTNFFPNRELWPKLIFPKPISFQIQNLHTMEWIQTTFNKIHVPKLRKLTNSIAISLGNCSWYNWEIMCKLQAMIMGKSQNSAAAVVEYCIQNSKCTTIAVKKKNKKEGGYLISTKKHKNFWLLA